MTHATVKNFSNLLGGMSARTFLKEYWQRQPLLIRNAIPGFGSALDRAGLLDLSGREDLESRFVSHAGASWEFAHGPFTRAQIKRWRKPWSVLVQGVNLALPFGDELLRAFDFIPYARLDDLMVSFATDGGGVGPHIDNYDVFLLQGTGCRRWRIGKQSDQTSLDDVPLRILKNFIPTEDWLLEPGDMLYLPPEWAHDGVAEGNCMTWSIGFRTAPVQEIADQFLIFLQDHLALDGRYSDPGLRLQKHPAEIGAAMIDQVEAMLDRIRWDRTVVKDFLGTALTEPKPHVYFNPPATPMSARRFRARLKATGTHLDARTQLLFAGKSFYLNGEKLTLPPQTHQPIRQLADNRHLPSTGIISDDLLEILYDWYCSGFLNSD